MSQLPEKPKSAIEGEAIFVYAFDVAYDMTRAPIPALLGQDLQEYAIGPSRRVPKHLFFYRPRMLTLPPVWRRLADRDVEVRRNVKIFSVGAISVQYRVPVEADRFEDLVAFHDLAFAGGGSVEQESMELAEQVRRELAPYCIRPVERLQVSQPYTVFVLPDLPGGAASAEAWLRDRSRDVAGVLTQEEDAAHLSAQEVAESTGRYLSYYERDLVVLDWDAALVVGEQDALDDILHIVELANVQLVELAAYDRVLDAGLDAAYRDLAHRAPRPKRDVRRNLRELRVDMARLSDELLNTMKFFGDWHLARIYTALAERFHVADRHRILEKKLETLGDLYELLQQDRVNRWMMVLEATIVLLFILDVVLLLMGLAE